MCQRKTRYGFITNTARDDSIPQKFVDQPALKRSSLTDTEQRQELVLNVTSLMFSYAFMVSSAVYAALAALMVNSASCAQSAAICTVAALHYSAMKRAVLSGEGDSPNGVPGMSALTDNRIQLYLMYADWLTTFPMLSIKLLTMAKSGSGKVDPFWDSKFMYPATALISLAMIVSGAMSVIITGDWGVSTNGKSRAFRIVAMLVGMVCLILLYTIIYTVAEQAKSEHGPAVYIFSLVWLGYPTIAGLEMMLGPLIPAWRTLWIAILDVVSKAFLAIYVATDVLENKA